MFHRPENVRKLRGQAVDMVAAGKMEGDGVISRWDGRRWLNTDGQQHRILSDRYAVIQAGEATREKRERKGHEGDNTEAG